ncbi:hypothetical protein V2J09_008037 [Rumex salicifolius]
MPPLQLTSQNVAVIGGGAAGLVAARELRREGHKVVVFERESQLGGTWLYNPQIESDPIGLDPNRKVVHSSLYQSLRTNLPREVMGFRDFPFVATGDLNRDSRRFPSHEEVLRYLEDFAYKFKLNELVRYRTDVKRVELENGKLKVRSSTMQGGNGNEADETFDAVLVCNGHYSQPQIAEVPDSGRLDNKKLDAGIEKWPGKQIHSHNYRVPEPYKNQVVVIIGSASSGSDISIELAEVAKEVHVVSRSASNEALGKLPGYDNLWIHSMIANANQDGTLTFQDGSTVVANVILHCTGYKYEFPFLHLNDAVTVKDNRVGPLYKHVFPPGLAPWLSFVGLPWKVIPFPQCELQSKWIAGALSGRIQLPSEQEMMEDVESFYAKMDEAGIAKRYTHLVGEHQFEYNDWLATQCGFVLTEEWRKKMYDSSSKMRKLLPKVYRDIWNEESLILEAHNDFAKYLK